MTLFTIIETLAGSAWGTSLHGSVVRRSLSWCLLTTLLLGMLVVILLLVRVALRILTMIPLIRWSLEPLLEALLRVGARTSIVSRGLSLKPPLLGLHLVALIVNNFSMIHQHLKIGVCIGHKLELQTVIQTLAKAALLISIISHLIQSIACQLSEFVTILSHRHRSLFQSSELLLLQLYQSFRYMVRYEILSKFLSGDRRSISGTSILECLPPVLGFSLKLS